MANKIVKEKQCVNTLWFMGGIGLFLVGMIVVFVANYLNGNNMEWLGFGSFAFVVAMLALGMWYIWRLQLKISVNRKGIKYRMAPWHTESQKIKWKEIEDYEFVKSPEVARWSGSDLHLGLTEERFSLCGNNGIWIQTKDGREVFLGSKKLLRYQDEISNLIQQKA